MEHKSDLLHCIEVRLQLYISNNMIYIFTLQHKRVTQQYSKGVYIGLYTNANINTPTHLFIKVTFAYVCIITVQEEHYKIVCRNVETILIFKLKFEKIINEIFLLNTYLISEIKFCGNYENHEIHYPRYRYSPKQIFAFQNLLFNWCQCIIISSLFINTNPVLIKFPCVIFAVADVRVIVTCVLVYT